MPIGAGRVVARSYMAFAVGLLGLNCLRGGIAGGGVPYLTGHGSDSSVCINGYWCENHFIMKKITNDVIT